jgi:RNA polymerase sigma-70 factor, ECF subfamily
MFDVSDQELITQLQSQHLEALGSLYDRYRNMVYRTTLGITGDPEAANDLSQDVFLRLYRYADHVDPSRPLEPWLYRMSTNLAYTWVKRNRRWLQPLEDLVDWLSSGGNSPHEHAEKTEDWEQVQQALQALPLQQRVVVVLYYLSDLSVNEISEILEVPSGTVKSRLHYGRLGLKKLIGIAGLAEGEKLPEFKMKGSEGVSNA